MWLLVLMAVFFTSPIWVLALFYFWALQAVFRPDPLEEAEKRKKRQQRKK